MLKPGLLERVKFGRAEFYSRSEKLQPISILQPIYSRFNFYSRSAVEVRTTAISTAAAVELQIQTIRCN